MSIEPVWYYGKYQGVDMFGPLTEWIDDGRRMRLMNLVSCTLGAETRTARPGLVFDGASLPRLLWPIMHSPFTGAMRKWAIIHDQDWYDAMALERDFSDFAGANKLRKLSNNFFEAGLRYDGRLILAQLAYEGVELGRIWERIC